jgi:NhaA family Na+:H+ antiporter
LAGRPDDSGVRFPVEPIHRLTVPLQHFLHVETAGGVMLLAATVTALGLANSPWAEPYLSIWQTKFTIGFGSFQMSYSLKHWINDGLMAILFFAVGLEVKREIVLGELLGIILFSFAAVKVKAARLPVGVSWRHIAGAGFLAGIGFTMAMFIAGLALDGASLDEAKIGILGASAVAAVLGMLILASTRPGSKDENA